VRTSSPGKKSRTGKTGSTWDDEHQGKMSRHGATSHQEEPRR
jgi:hypothetical protein